MYGMSPKARPRQSTRKTIAPAALCTYMESTAVSRMPTVSEPASRPIWASTATARSKG
jgi:hypothetical protein